MTKEELINAYVLYLRALQDGNPYKDQLLARYNIMRDSMNLTDDEILEIVDTAFNRVEQNSPK